MGRLSTISDAAVFDAVGVQISTFGSLKIQDVVSSTGVSIGSLYHRYGSREALLAQAWLDAVISFQSRFISALEGGGEDAGELAAMATPRFCRSDPCRARLLIGCRREELFSSDTPEEYREKLRAANARTLTSIKNFAAQNDHSVEACMMGLVAYPLGAVKLFLPDKKVPKRVDDYVAAAFQSAVRVK